ncbi:MAG: hypothetical protein H7222_07570 [Methylotenera sp.]|nr:hypothetical protein [Oligoflexia bacterium]
MTDHPELEAAKRRAELSRFDLESAVDRLDTRVQAVAATTHKILNYGREAERLARDFPYVNLAIFISAGFILGSFFGTQLNRSRTEPAEFSLF